MNNKWRRVLVAATKDTVDPIVISPEGQPKTIEIAMSGFREITVTPFEDDAQLVVLGRKQRIAIRLAIRLAMAGENAGYMASVLEQFKHHDSDFAELKS